MIIKVGDKVRIKKNLFVNKKYGAELFVEDMKIYKGEQAIITCDLGDSYKLDIDNGDFHWTDNMLEPIDQSDENTGEVSTNLVDIDQIKQFKKEDFKFGDIVTTRDGDKNIYLDECTVNKYQEFLYLSSYNEDLKDKDDDEQFDIMKVQRYIKKQETENEYILKTIYERKKEILDEKEKEYLRNVIEPFRERIKKVILKTDYDNFKYYIQIDFKLRNGLIQFPSFEKDTMYKNMELDKEYTLEELGL